MDFVYSDGGRAAAGYKGRAGDCVVRAIAIAAQKPYQEVYDAINAFALAERARRLENEASQIKALWSDCLSRAHTFTSASTMAPSRCSSQSGERALGCLKQARGLSPLPLDKTTTPNYSLNTHAPDQTGSRPRRLHCWVDLAAPSCSILTRNHFHELSRANGPRGQGRKCSVTLEQQIENSPVRSDSRDFGVPGSFLPLGAAWI